MHARTTWQTIRAGQYDWRRPIGGVLAVTGALVALAQLADRLPPSLQPIMAVIGPWAESVSVVLGAALVKLGKPVIVRGES
jgi:hypothetical protein